MRQKYRRGGSCSSQDEREDQTACKSSCVDIEEHTDSPDEMVTGFYYRGGVLFKDEVGVKGDAEEF